MFRLTLKRCMHDRKIPNITTTRVYPPVKGSYDSPRKFDYSKPSKKEPSKWKNLWPKYRVHSQQYREYSDDTPLMDGHFELHDIGPKFREDHKVVVKLPVTEMGSWKATHGDGRRISSWGEQPIDIGQIRTNESGMWYNSDATGTSLPAKPTSA